MVVHDDSGSLVFVTMSDSTVVAEAEVFAIAESYAQSIRAPGTHGLSS